MRLRHAGQRVCGHAYAAPARRIGPRGELVQNDAASTSDVQRPNASTELWNVREAVACLDLFPRQPAALVTHHESGGPTEGLLVQGSGLGEDLYAAHSQPAVVQSRQALYRVLDC